MDKTQKNGSGTTPSPTTPSLCVEITFGLNTAEGKLCREDILASLKKRTTAALACDQRWVPFVVTEGHTSYAHERQAIVEPVLILTSDKDPEYNADLSDGEWKVLVETIARKLAQEFNQEHLYVTYLPAHVLIIRS